MKLAVDARLMLGHIRGMGQYARMVTEPVAGQSFALVPASQAATLSMPGKAAGWGFEPWWEQCVLPRLAAQCGATHLLCPANTGPVWLPGMVRRIVVIHDLIYLAPASELPWSRSAYQNLGRIYRRVVVPAVASRAHHILTVSQYTRKLLVDELAVPPDRVTVVPNTIASEWFCEAPLADSARSPHLLCVAGEAPSKNVGRLLEAFGLAARQGRLGQLQLIVVGIRPAFHEGFLRHARLVGVPEGQLSLQYDLPSARLQALYRTAWGCIVPSLYEGFGIPALEALACGTPLACSNATSLPEVTGGHAWAFEPRSTEDMARAICEMARSEERASAAAEGQLHARQAFHPRVVQQQARAFWQQIGQQ